MGELVANDKPDRRRGRRRNGSPRRPHPRKAPLDARSPHVARRCAMKASLAGWAFTAPALSVIALFFVLPVLAAFALVGHRLRHLRARRSAQPALRRARQLHRAAAAIRCSGRRWATRCTSCWSAFRLSIVASLGGGAVAAFEARALQALVPHLALRAGGDDGGRGRGDLALPLPHALRHGELAARAGGHRPDRLAGRSALVDADDHPVRRVEELRLQHDHLPGRACRRSPKTCTKPRASTAQRLVAAVAARHACRCSGRCCCCVGS